MTMRTHLWFGDIIKTYIEFVNRPLEEYQAAMEALYSEYGNDTVNDIIHRIKSTEYKRKRLPVVVQLKNN